jgi:hypothetical protein
MEWKDDWPVINGGQKVTLKSGPGLYEYEPPVSWRDDFSDPKLQLGWYRKSTRSKYPMMVSSADETDTPVKIDYSLTERPNHLRLHGGPYNLSSPACPTLFLRKQSSRHCTWETRLSFQPSSVHVEAGTVLYWNYFTNSSIGIRLSPEGKRIVRFRPAEGEIVDREVGPSSDIIFLIDCGDRYRFGFKEVSDGVEPPTQWIGEVANSVMTRAPPVGAPFTGMMLGLYSYGELQKCLAPADFHYAEFQ